MNGNLDELYLRWLYGLISPITVKNPERTYWSFAKQLYQKEFFWYVPNDDNRDADGKDLRLRFLYSTKLDVEDSEWLTLPCSMLELLVAMSQRLTFMGEKSLRDYFWEMVYNGGIEQCSDQVYVDQPEIQLDVDEFLNNVIWRTYTFSGHKGGLFPLNDPKQDQRKTELWYQMAAYVMERE